MKKPVLVIIHGGGCRQIENVTGILKAFDEKNIRIDGYFTSSAGSIIAPLHASGLSGNEIECIIKKTPVNKLFKLDYLQLAKLFIPFVKTDYVYNTSGLKSFLRKHITTLKVMLDVKVSVTRLKDYKSMMMDADLDSILASSAIPEAFPPIKIDNEYYADGGILNNIPTCKIKEINDYKHIYIFLCNQDTKANKKSYTKIGRALKNINMTMDREVHQIYESGWDDLDNVTVIQPPPYRSHLLKWSKDFGLIKHSYEYTKNLLKGKK